MNHKRLVTVAVMLTAVLALVGGPPVRADLEVGETPLSQNGWAYEANLDSQGKLWVSDLDAGEIWSLNTNSGAHTAYQVGGQPSDAHSDGAGSVWWADFGSNRLGRLSTAANQATVWKIPDSSSLYSIAIDSSGNVWVSDFDLSFLYKLDPNTNRLCTFTLPDAGVSEYLVVDGQALWFGDFDNARIVRLQNDTFDWWNLPGGSYPMDLELDDTGRVWWTDNKKGYLGRLDTDTATITTFTPPASGKPVMLALSGDKVWYSQQNPEVVVVLDPAVAASQTGSVTTGSQTAQPNCNTLLPLAPTTVTADSGQASWSGQIYATTLDTVGWVIYQMPQGSTPWGISAADQVWLVDQARHVLARLGPTASIPGDATPSPTADLPTARATKRATDRPSPDDAPTATQAFTNTPVPLITETPPPVRPSATPIPARTVAPTLASQPAPAQLATATPALPSVAPTSMASRVPNTPTSAASPPAISSTPETPMPARPSATSEPTPALVAKQSSGNSGKPILGPDTSVHAPPAEPPQRAPQANFGLLIGAVVILIAAVVVAAVILWLSLRGPHNTVGE